MEAEKTFLIDAFNKVILNDKYKYDYSTRGMFKKFIEEAKTNGLLDILHNIFFNEYYITSSPTVIVSCVFRYLAFQIFTTLIEKEYFDKRQKHRFFVYLKFILRTFFDGGFLTLHEDIDTNEYIDDSLSCLFSDSVEWYFIKYNKYDHDPPQQNLNDNKSEDKTDESEKKDNEKEEYVGYHWLEMECKL